MVLHILNTKLISFLTFAHLTEKYLMQFIEYEYNFLS